MAACSVEGQLHFPCLVLLSDDWGCFNSDIDVIHGLAYPKMKIDNQRIDMILDELENHGLLFRWQDGLHQWGFWVKWDEHQYSSSTAVNGAGQRVKHRRKTPEPPAALLKGYINQYYTGKLEQFGTKRDETEQTAFNLNPNPNLKPNLNPDIVPEIIGYLNTRTGKKFSPKSESTVKLISGRLSEGHTLDDFKRVIDVKVAKWRGDPKMDDYLRPDTLFRPSNFESYLNEQPTRPPVGTNVKPPTSREEEYRKAREEFIKTHGDDKDTVAGFSQEWWEKNE